MTCYPKIEPHRTPIQILSENFTGLNCANSPNMLVLFLFALLLIILNFLELPESATHMIFTIQNVCKTQFDFLKYSEFHSALICGTKIYEPKVKTLLTQSGLYHLVVVSSAHLIMLQGSLQKMGQHYSLLRYLIKPSVAFYTILTGLQPPVVRALLHLKIESKNKTMALGLSAVWISLFSTLITFSILGKNSSLSLALSFASSLALILSSQIQIFKFKTLQDALLVWIFLLPIISQWGNIHPITILVNVFLAFTITIIFIPLSILCLLIPSLQILDEILLDLLFRTLEFICSGNLSLIDNSRSQLNEMGTWLYLSCLWILTNTFVTHKKRRLACSDLI